MIEIRVLDECDFPKYSKKIAKLFEICFDKEIDQSLWEWAYIKNPSGSPVIATAMDNNELVGHYAVTPMVFMEGGFQQVGYLSMTTMVHPNYRKHGLFVELASAAYLEADEQTFVYGFPNENSIPGFKKKLHWEIFDEYKIVTVTARALFKLIDSGSLNTVNPLNMNNDTFLNWRLSKPGMNYLVEGNLVYKEFNGEIDLLTIYENVTSVFKTSKMNFNILTKDPELIEASISHKKYSFGRRSLTSTSKLNFLNPNLFMSDVF
jgi:hypothetical protein